MTEIIESPELQQIGKQALQDLLANLTQAKGFVLEQAPEFCQQIIARGLYLNAATGAVALAFGALLLVVAAACGWALHREARKGILESSERVVVPAMLGSICSLIASIPITICGLQYLREALAVYVAPKVFLVEEITRMVR